MAEETKPETKTYRGNCHCGAFIYELTCPEIKAGSSCNCSICFKKGVVWTMPPKDSFKIVKGSVADDLTDYHPEGGKANIHHKFCKNCGTAVFATMGDNPSPGVVNVRTIQDLDIWGLEKTPFDGWKIEPQYKVPEYKGEKPTHEIEGGKMYTGSCRCGAVTVALITKPLDSTYDSLAIDCNCSICVRYGCLWIYPDGTQSVISGTDNLSTYRFGRKLLQKTFCKTCGVPISNEFIPRTPEEIAALPEELQKFLEARGHKRPLNIRILNNYSVEDSGVKVTKNTIAKTMLPEYINP